MDIQEYWNKYLEKSHQKPEEATYSGELSFEDSSLVGNEQLNLLLSGRKTASFTPLEVFEINMEPLPIAGEVYIVLDREEKPQCIIEVTDVKVIPLSEISWELAKQDGENENLQEWQEKMEEFLQDEADICGFEAKKDSKIVCEIYRKIYC